MRKRKRNEYLALPKRRPGTIRAWHKWHRKILEDCIFCEFEKRAIGAALAQINQEIKTYVGWSKEDPMKNAAHLALKHLNRLRTKWLEELQVMKQVVRTLHDTNQAIIASLLKAHGAGAYVHQVQSQDVRRGAHLLHEPGWLFESASVEHLEKQGYAAFLTFGTVFDQGGVDLVGFPKPSRRVRWRKLPRIKRWSKPKRSHTARENPAQLRNRS